MTAKEKYRGRGVWVISKIKKKYIAIFHHMKDVFDIKSVPKRATVNVSSKILLAGPLLIVVLLVYVNVK